MINKTDHKQTPSAEQAPRATRREEDGMMKRKASDSKIQTRKVPLIELKARDRALLAGMAKRYQVNNLVDFLEGIVMNEQGPTVVARFYDDPADKQEVA